MEPVIVLDNIPFQADIEALMKQMHVQPDTSDAEDMQKMVAEVERIARPKAMYALRFIDSKDDDGVVVEGTRFSSRVLRVNLDKAERVFLYIATCGRELDDWAHTLDDPLHQFWAEAIKIQALGAASRMLTQHLTDTYQPGKTSDMNPGSLADWPLREQRPLFRSLGDPFATIGVELTASCLMVPNKSVSGIRFPTEESFASCMLCPRPECPNRRAPHDPVLFEQKYRKQAE
ncbi:MAG: vitamin B12 dependent methionine synthase [Chloroflexi bacterium]|jgi:hypothetical protein|nr:vitamin B12 dependent methionine synthase [Chloroflexota bacterium]